MNTDIEQFSKVPADVRRLRRPPKVMVTKIGLDGHDRGSRLVASFLRDAGMEVIYTGPWQEIPTVVNQAAQEDVDAIGVSSLATDHLLVPKLMRALDAAGMGDVVVIVGGIVPDQDEKMLQAEGVAAVFHPGSSRDDIVNQIAALIVARRQRLGTLVTTDHRLMPTARALPGRSRGQASRSRGRRSSRPPATAGRPATRPRWAPKSRV